ncbi:MAG: B12-binding domain-containing radical SAM protein [Deltaproteobacteria bacterium]|nr:B12-binding domain-containing radical SAM protein [Deltaproteobacteria bacterium]
MAVHKTKNILLLFPKFEEGFVMGKVPLGLAYIASMLQSRGHYVEAYNLVVDPVGNIDFDRFDYVGITCLTAFISQVRVLVEWVKEKNPKIKVVVGGPHPSMKVKDSLFISDKIDFVVVGEGERPFSELVESENPYSVAIPGVYFLEKGEVKGLPANTKFHLDELPFPNQRIFDHGNLEKQNPFRSISASRGCPFACFNCQPYLRNLFSFRMRSPQNVVDEMILLNREYGQNYFGFVDSEFPFNKKWFLEYHDLVKKADLDFQFHCNAFSKLIDEDILRAYKDMNITRLAIGVESGNQYIVDEVLHKRINLEKTRENFAMADLYGIKTHAYFMVGIPGESLKNMQETLAFALNLPANSIEFNILTPWPGTRFHDMCEEKGWINKDYRYEDYNEKRVGVISTDQWTGEEVVAFHKTATEAFQLKGWRLASDGSVFFRPDEAVPSPEEIQEIKSLFHVEA